MKYPHGSKRVSGILVPLAALVSEQSVGCGEFADLPALGAWSASAGQSLIQLLPVNDTGSQSSPYSAVSAFALHPIYIRIADLPEFAASSDEITARVQATLSAVQETHHGAARFDYPAIRQAKDAALRTIFAEQQESILADKALGRFVRANHWVKAYAVYCHLKAENGERAWTTWDDHREPSAADIERIWKRASMKAATRFYAWVQMRAAEQFGTASAALQDQGIALKGDLPILMNEDSVDAWQHPDIFRRELRAGAPPDMFSQLGQNWGFPIYDWDQLAREDYGWWKERLRVAGRYYHAFRIDHVLGFFRIWANGLGNWSGILGYFWPQHGISMDELRGQGFDDGRVRWLSEPHMFGQQLREALGPEWEQACGLALEQLPGEDLYRFLGSGTGAHAGTGAGTGADTDRRSNPPAITGEQSISDLPLSQSARDHLLAAWRDRALVLLPDGRFAPTWNFRACSRYQTLTDGEKDRFEGLVAARAADSNELWAERGRTILGDLAQSTDMLACAEDLGVVPDAVPRVLGGLGILGLKIPRWAHYWDQEGQPLIPLHHYPELSVCAASVHDTSTMRAWWEQEEGRHELWAAIGGGAVTTGAGTSPAAGGAPGSGPHDTQSPDTHAGPGTSPAAGAVPSALDTAQGPAPDRFTPDVAAAVYRALMNSQSRIVVFQLQDLLALEPELLDPDPGQERINIPGTYSDFNWTWRMPLTVQDLERHSSLTKAVRTLTQEGRRM